MNQREILLESNAGTRVLSRQNTENNRTLQHQKRAKQRMLLRQNGRNIPVSPTPVEECQENKENVLMATASEPAMAISKMTRQQAYLQRFLDWKAQQKQQKEIKDSQRRQLPRSSIKLKDTTHNNNNTFAPNNYQFQPPTILKNPIANEQQNCNQTETKNGRRSFYTLRSPPKLQKTQIEESRLAASNSQKVALPRKLDFGGISNILPTKCLSSKRLQTKPKPTTAASKPTTTIKPTTTTKTTIAKSKTTVTSTCTNKPVLRSTVNKLNTGGAVQKAHQLLEKCQPPATKAKLAVSMKAKKSTAISKAAGLRNFNKKDLQVVITKADLKKTRSNKPSSPLPRARVPVKSQLPNAIKGGTVACAKACTKPETAAKSSSRPLATLNLPENAPLLRQPQIESPLQTPLDLMRTSARFDPLVTSTQQRSSCTLFDFEAASKDTQEQPGKPEQAAVPTRNSAQKRLSRQWACDIDFMRNVSAFGENDKEEDCTENTLKPANFVSSFVSVSRGKVSAEKERERRNSVYLNKSGTEEIASPETDVDTMLETQAAEVLEKRRTLEAVHYFRQQLDLETTRLLALCDDWAAYRGEQLAQLQALGGDDMIDVAVGQTRLLTSKKFKQFSGLIDRCEAGVTGVGARPDDGSEDTKPISSIDLEGFWSMLGLQVDNLDQRFANLQRWKSNNWVDPDAVKRVAPKTKPKQKAAPAVGGGVKKPAAKASSGLRELMRKAQAERRKNQVLENNNNTVLIMTPSKATRPDKTSCTSRKSNRRDSIVVRDRKQFSNSPTIISVSARRRTSSASMDTPKLLPHVRELERSLGQMQNALLKVAINGASNQRRDSQLAVVSPQRKSILKTPGTERSALRRNVSFRTSEMLRTINFIIGSSDSESDEDTQSKTLQETA